MPIKAQEIFQGSWTPFASLNAIIGPPSIVTVALPQGVPSVPYTSQIIVKGGTIPFAWSVSTGTLPAGLALSQTGVISGTPTTLGNSSFTISVTDALGVVATAALSITIAAAPVLTITTTTLPSGTQSSAYAGATLAAINDTGPDVWSLFSGTLPAGLALSSGGVISGTPTGTGTSSFVVKVTDSTSATATASLSIRVVASGTLAITTTSAPQGSTGAAYTAPFAATGGTNPDTWSISAGALPPGLSISASTGAISGIPSVAGTSSFTVHVADSASHTDTQAITIVITNSLVVTTLSLPDAVKSTAYNDALASANGFGAITWAQTGGLPAGLALNASTGVISGTPTTLGTSSFTATATDAGGNTASKALSITVDSTASNPLFGLNTGGGQGGPNSKPYWADAFAALNPSAPSKPFGFSDYQGSVSAFPTSVGTMPANADWLLNRWVPPIPPVLSGSQDGNIRTFITSATNFINANGPRSLWITFFHEVDAPSHNIAGSDYIDFMCYVYPRLKGTKSGWTGEPRLQVGCIYTGFDASTRLPNYLVVPNNGTKANPTPPMVDFYGFDRYSNAGNNHASAATLYTSANGAFTQALAIQPNIKNMCMTEGNAEPDANAAQFYTDMWALSKSHGSPIFVPFYFGKGLPADDIGWPPAADCLTELKNILKDSD